MGRKKPSKSLIQQVKEEFDSKLKIGESKYPAKLRGIHTQYIFSWETYRSYLKHCCYFVRWSKDQAVDPLLGHKPRTVAECRPFAEKWIKYNMDRGLSAYTLKLQLSALGKLYGCSITDFDVVTPPRKRSNITRSRGVAAGDKHFSITANQDLITFCRCTGLRRAELSQIRGTDLMIHDDELCLDVRRGNKGGRLRIVSVTGTSEELETVKRLCTEAGGKKIFPHPNKHADIHSYRAEYATRIYNQHRRNLEDFKHERLIIYKNQIIDSYISKNGKKNYNKTKGYYATVNGIRCLMPGYRDVSAVYYCRDDLKGTVYDRRALFKASAALGHNRESIVAEHYLR